MSHKAKFSFNDEVSQSPKPKKKGKRGVFDFNKFEQDQQQNKQKMPKEEFMNTLDTLGKKTTFTPIENQPQPTPAINQPVNLGKITLEQTSMRIEERHHQEDEVKIAKYLHAQEVIYIEKLFLDLLTGKKGAAFQGLLKQGKISGNDRFAKEQVLMYLLLSTFLKEKFEFVVDKTYSKVEKSKIPFNEDKSANIKKWAIYALRKHPQFSKLIEEKSLPNRWMMLAQNRINELANEFIQKKLFDQAIIVSNMQDKAFLQSFESYSSVEMKKEYNFIKGKDVKIIPKSEWIIDFAVAIQYFESSTIDATMKDLCKKYQDSHNILFSSLIALTLHYANKKQDRVLERYMEKIIFQEKRLGYLDQLLHLYTLKEYREQYPKLFIKTVQSLCSKIRNPKIFVDLLIFSDLNRNQISSAIIILTEKNLFFSQNRDKNTQLLHQTITQRYQDLESDNNYQINVLYSWVQCEKYLKLFGEKRYIQSARCFSEKFQIIQTSIIHEPKKIIQTLIKNIVKFEFACSYKQSSQRQYYTILQKIRPNLRQQFDITIIQGCLAFIELKFKVFWLHEEQKLSRLYQLFLYLKSSIAKKQSTDNAKYFVVSIRKALEDILSTIDGKIYLNELVEKETNKKEVAVAIKTQLKQREVINNQTFKKSTFFKLLEMLNWNQAIGNSLVIKLLF